MSRSFAALASADIVLTGDLGSAGAAVRVDDLSDATPMTSATSSITYVDVTPPWSKPSAMGLRDLGDAINLSAAAE